VADLKGELDSLKIDRSRPPRSPWRRPLLLLVPAAVILLVLYGLQARQTLSTPEIETVTVAVSRDVAPSAGTPILSSPRCPLRPAAPRGGLFPALRGARLPIATALREA
jgi:hypothetical protein